MRNLTYLLGVSGVGGIIFSILAGIRWAVTFPDLSQAIIAGILGVLWAILMFGFAYTYEKLDLILKKQRTEGEKFDSFVQHVNGQIKLDEWRNRKI